MEALIASAYALTASISWSPCIPKDKLIARLSRHPENEIVLSAPDVIVKTSRYLVHLSGISDSEDFSRLPLECEGGI